MSKPKYRWWGYALNVVKDISFLYPGKNLTQGDEIDRAALLRAIDETKQEVNGDSRIALIIQVYGSTKRRTIKEASAIIGIPESTAKIWHGDFVWLVGAYLLPGVRKGS